MEYEVKAQSNDEIVAVYEADNLFDAAEMAANDFEADIDVPTGESLVFEGESDYYDLYKV